MPPRSIAPPRLPARPRECHKGSFGRLLIAAGSVGYTGAPTLCARAAVRAGAGLVFLGVPEAIYPITAVKNDEAMPFPLPCDDAGRLSVAAADVLLPRLARCTALVLGPGLGRTDALRQLVPQLTRAARCPVVLDADALWAVADTPEALRGTDDGMDLSAITEIADFMEREIGIEVSPRQPFVGRHFNVTRAGIHADGMLKDEEIYNIFDTAKLLNRPAAVAVDSHSGAAGVAHWINGYFRLSGENTIGKTDPLVVSVKEQVDALYAAGRNTVMGDEELEIMVRNSNVDRYERLLFHKSH